MASLRASIAAAGCITALPQKQSDPAVNYRGRATQVSIRLSAFLRGRNGWLSRLGGTSRWVFMDHAAVLPPKVPARRAVILPGQPSCLEC